MTFSIAALLIIIFLAYKAAPKEKKEHALVHGPVRSACWRR